MLIIENQTSQGVAIFILQLVGTLWTANFSQIRMISNPAIQHVAKWIGSYIGRIPTFWCATYFRVANCFKFSVIITPSSPSHASP